MGKKAGLLWAFCLLLFTACDTVQYFAVETQMPATARYTLLNPVVVVANNSVLQPADSGVAYYIGARQLQHTSLPKDSAFSLFFTAFVEELGTSTQFQEVLTYDAALRTDSEYLGIRSLSNSKANQLLSGAQAQMLVTVDRLLFTVTQRLVGEHAFFTGIDIEAAVDISLYNGETGAVQSYTIADTLNYSNYVGQDRELFLFDLPNYLLLTLAENLAYKTSHLLVPYVQYAERLFYTGIQSDMRTAYAYAKNENWTKAAEVWTKIYEQSKGKARGMAAINRATVEELQNGYTTALAWVDKAIEAYKQEKPEKVKAEMEYALQYRKTLQGLRESLLHLKY